MARGIMYVETRPASPEQAEAYHRWYNDVHIPELLGVDGFVSARRFEPLGHDGPFVAIYEIEADDIEAVRDRQSEATRSGGHTAPTDVQMDPPPVVRYYREIGVSRSAEG
jgi:hypothetical protein